MESPKHRDPGIGPESEAALPRGISFAERLTESVPVTFLELLEEQPQWRTVEGSSKATAGPGDASQCRRDDPSRFGGFGQCPPTAETDSQRARAPLTKIVLRLPIRRSKGWSRSQPR